MQISLMPGLGSTTAVSSRPGERTELREYDGDGDDGKAGAAAPPAQTVNLNGQLTGQVIHATA